MNSQTTYGKNGRPLGAIISEIKGEITEFAQTRYQMLMAEMKEKISAWKSAVPLLVVALVFGGTAFLLLTGALVVIIAAALGIGWALLVVGLGYLILGAAAGWIGYRELSTNSVTPERTLRVLKQDQVWLQSETRSA